MTILTEQTIYQSSDFRLTNFDTKQIITDTSTKLVILRYSEWNGFISYTGIGRYGARDTSELIIEWLVGQADITFEDVATRICDKGTEWLKKIETTWRRERHTFILAGFMAGIPHLAIISNFEDCSGRNDPQAASSLAVSYWRFKSRPQIVVTGYKLAVRRFERRRLERLIGSKLVDPAWVRRTLAEVNHIAAISTTAKGMISPTCSVVSFRADGQGVGDIQGAVDIRSLVMGMPMPDLREVAKDLGLDSPVLSGMTFATSKPRIPYAPCLPRTVIPSDAGYRIRELRHKDFASCRARDISHTGLILGDGNPPDNPGVSVLWTSPVNGDPTPCNFIAAPGGLNQAGEVAATAKMNDGCDHAILWRGESLIDLGCYRGTDSGAVAINATGLVVGWVCLDAVNKGQINFRPAAWISQRLTVLEDFDCNWGQAVAVNDAGLVLIVGYVKTQCRAILWNPLARTTEIVGGGTGIYPAALTTEGIVLGTARDSYGKSVAWLAKPNQHWERLDTEPGFYATGINDIGDIVGAAVRDGYEQPWLRRATGEIIWLPYFDQHWCRPSTINNSGVIVGTAQTDHGTHALVWTR